MVGRLSNNHWDLGLNPKSPKILVIIFFHIIPCRFQKRLYHAPQISMRQVSSSSHPVAKDDDYHTPQSMSIQGIAKVNVAGQLNGLQD